MVVFVIYTPQILSCKCSRTAWVLSPNFYFHLDLSIGYLLLNLIDNQNSPCIKGEEWIIGAILNKPENFERARAVLSSEDFFSMTHRKIFQAFEVLDREGIPLDLTTIATYLKAEEIGVARFLRDDTPTERTLDHWIRVIKKASLERDLRTEAGKDDLDAKKVEALAYEINSLQGPVSLYRPIAAISRRAESPACPIPVSFHRRVRRCEKIDFKGGRAGILEKF